MTETDNTEIHRRGLVGGQAVRKEHNQKEIHTGKKRDTATDTATETGGEAGGGRATTCAHVSTSPPCPLRGPGATRAGGSARAQSPDCGYETQFSPKGTGLRDQNGRVQHWKREPGG